MMQQKGKTAATRKFLMGAALLLVFAMAGGLNSVLAVSEQAQQIHSGSDEQKVNVKLEDIEKNADPAKAAATKAAAEKAAAAKAAAAKAAAEKATADAIELQKQEGIKQAQQVQLQDSIQKIKNIDPKKNPNDFRKAINECNELITKIEADLEKSAQVLLPPKVDIPAQSSAPSSPAAPAEPQPPAGKAEGDGTTGRGAAILLFLLLLLAFVAIVFLYVFLVRVRRDLEMQREAVLSTDRKVDDLKLKPPAPAPSVPGTAPGPKALGAPSASEWTEMQRKQKDMAATVAGLAGQVKQTSDNLNKYNGLSSEVEGLRNSVKEASVKLGTAIDSGLANVKSEISRLDREAQSGKTTLQSLQTKRAADMNEIRSRLEGVPAETGKKVIDELVEQQYVLFNQLRSSVGSQVDRLMAHARVHIERHESFFQLFYNDIGKAVPSGAETQRGHEELARQYENILKKTKRDDELLTQFSNLDRVEEFKSRTPDKAGRIIGNYYNLLILAQNVALVSELLELTPENWVRSHFLEFADLFIKAMQKDHLATGRSPLDKGYPALVEILDRIGWEPIPIELGQTLFDGRLHFAVSNAENLSMMDGVVIGVEKNGFRDKLKDVVAVQPRVIVVNNSRQYS